MKEIPLRNGGVALVDDADYDLVVGYAWRRNVMKNKRTQYACCLRYEKPRHAVMLYMHRIIAGALTGEQIDHIDHDGLNNQRSNLRVCTQSENNANGRKRQGCSSQYKGVTWRKDTEKWQAQAWWNGQRHSIGCFESERDAALAYNQFAATNYGDGTFILLNEVN